MGRGVVKCLDFYHELRGKPCLVTEYIDGKCLLDVMEEREGRRLELEIALRIAVQVAETIAWTHEKFLVHRDLTPKNILLADFQPDPSRVRVKIICAWTINTRASCWPETICSRTSRG